MTGVARFTCHHATYLSMPGHETQVFHWCHLLAHLTRDAEIDFFFEWRRGIGRDLALIGLRSSLRVIKRIVTCEGVCLHDGYRRNRRDAFADSSAPCAA